LGNPPLYAKLAAIPIESGVPLRFRCASHSLGQSSISVSDVKTGIEAFRRELDTLGFNLFCVLDGHQISGNGCDGSLLLIGNAGSMMWQKLPADWHRSDNPIDDYTSQTVQQLVEKHLADLSAAMLFPDNASRRPLPSLQQLGRLAGWHCDSPLGIGVHAEHGLWYAYRAVVYLPISLPGERPTNPPAADLGIGAGHSPCLDCVDQPCISACPSKALSDDRPPDMQRCAGFRLKPDSMCRTSCAARLACPVAPQWRYSTEQIAYHYHHSLRSIRQWMDQP
jgi:hypothetical protein